jgi:type I restriction-modification system DNA methylase subunit
MFQKSVLESYLKSVDKKKVSDAFEVFKKYYGNQERLQNIADSKEEQYQEGFLRDLFVNVFGYTINPDPNYNLTTEFKNLHDAKKADGAILKDGKPVAVIELKSNKTKNLESIQDQAFRYKNGQKDCRYVVTSNFRLIRFYVDDATEYEEFNLFDIKEHEFELMYFLLNKENILTDVPFKLKSDSKFHEDNISNKLYKDYSVFREEIYQNIIQKNPDIDKLELYKKTQKLLDRFLFIFFAEDRGLIPPNSISEVISQWQKLKDLNEYRPLYERFIKFFGYLNNGYEYNGYVIHAYNGGLFKPDNVLDEITIDDEPLIKNCMTLSKYDFDSEVDVNILGHIFEHSLGDIEEKAAEISGEKVDKTRTRRKKDGVFYTPKFITKYIVENTIGTLCKDKKKELGIDAIDIDESYITKAGKVNKKGQELDNLLQNYKKWLLSLKILDPACGSGAFLNEALDFLIKEHRTIDDMSAQILQNFTRLTDTDKEILEHNLYGVDINDESVEIAKLSLWLRTAQKGRKLSDLNGNIKCGNSLIDDPAYAGDKAFKWNEEFKEIMDNGGFDVVIGNPPYVRQELLGSFKPYFVEKYSVYEGTSDLFAYFYELSFSLLKTGRYFGFISNSFNKTKGGSNLRKYLQNNVTFDKLLDFTNVQIFKGATTYPVILVAKNEKPKPNSSFDYLLIPKSSSADSINIASVDINVMNQAILNSDSWNFGSDKISMVLEKIKANRPLKEQFGKSYRGLLTGLNEAFIIDEETKDRLIREDAKSAELIKPLYEGKDLSKWASPEIKKYIILIPKGYSDKLSIGFDKTYPAIYNYLLQFKEKAEKRFDQGDYWWELRNCAYYDLFEQPKIVWPNLQSINKFSLDSSNYYINNPSAILPINYKTLLNILNSKIVWIFLTSICAMRSGGYIEVKPQYFEQIPVPDLSKIDKKPFEELAETVINLTNSRQSKIDTFHKLLLSDLKLTGLTGKLELFYKYDVTSFLSELKKQKIELSLKDKAEWMEYFDKCVSEIKTIQAEIDKTEKEIDQMVYQLYGLTPEEIQIVENSIRGAL